MASQKNLKIIQTKYFDIIYAPDSTQSATILFEKADSLYDELAQKYNMLYQIRFPVVIAPSNDEFNAYYSSSPFDHIVIYDTPTSENFSVFSDVFLNTFRHELIHAITYNLRNDFWHDVSRFLGNTYNPSLLTVTMGFAEGVAVASESDFGEGRVNNDFHLQFLRQAKIEGKFPKYSEIQGSRDIYPSGNYSYYFGGAFNSYLQQRFGMEKYAKFWYKCSNLQTLTYFGCFKKVFGIPIKQVWQDFYDSIPVPNVPKNPDEEEWCKSLIKKQNKHSLFEYMTSSELGVAFVDLYKNEVQLINIDGENFSKPKTLFSQTNIERLSFSSDGKFLSVSYCDDSGKLPKNRVKIYNTQNKHFYLLKEKSVREANVFCANGKYYVALVKTKSQVCKLQVYELMLNEKYKITGKNLIFENEFDFGKGIYSVCGDQNGNVFYIQKDKMDYSIVVKNIFTKEENIICAPTNTVLQNLSVCNTKNSNAEKFDARLAFSYTQKGTMPRLGLCGIDFERGVAKYRFSQKDASGGFFYPSYIGESNFAYIATFLQTKKLFVANAKKFAFKESEIPLESLSVNKELNVVENSDFDLETKNFFKEFNENSKNFSLFKYQFTGPKGTIIPASVQQQTKISSYDELDSSISIGLGITYITSSPWTIPLYGISAGYIPFENIWSLGLGIQGGTNLTQLFSYTVLSQVDFDLGGYKSVFGNINFSSVIPINSIFYLKLVENFKIFEGREDAWGKEDEKIGVLNLFSQTNNTSVGFGTIRKNGYGFYNYKGFEFTATYDESYCFRLTYPKEKYYDYQNIALDLKGRFKLGIPFSVDAMIFPSKKYFLAGLFNAYIFSYEIQKSTNFFPIFYANRISINTYYLAKFSYHYYEKPFVEPKSWEIAHIDKYVSYLAENDFSYSDEIALCTNFFFTPNIGGFARSQFEFELTGKLLFHPNAQPDENVIDFAINFTLSL